MQVGGQTGRTQHAELHQLLVSASGIEGLAQVRPGVCRLHPGQLQRVGACRSGWGVSPSHRRLGCPPRLPVWSSQSWTPSLSLPTRQEEDVFSQGEGLAVLVPCDLRARVSADVAGQGHAAVEGGGDLLCVQACDVRWDCPRGHRIKKDT